MFEYTSADVGLILEADGLGEVGRTLRKRCAPARFSTLRSWERTSMQMNLDRSRYSVTPSALALLEAALHGLAAAKGEVSADGRYVGAHRAASRAAAALVDARGGA